MKAMMICAFVAAGCTESYPYASCETEQFVDLEITPGEPCLDLQINRTNPPAGCPAAVLSGTNNCGSVFTIPADENITGLDQTFAPGEVFERQLVLPGTDDDDKGDFQLTATLGQTSLVLTFGLAFGA